jgi:hypothetical protein
MLKLEVIIGCPGNTELQTEVCHWRKTKYQLIVATAYTKLKLVMQNSVLISKQSPPPNK